MPVSMGRGKQYATVVERLTAAHGDDAQPIGITRIETTPVPLDNGVLVVTATVTFADGRVFAGMSQARFDATSGADATNPVECAETSAVGRALAMAGYASDAGIASSEEIATARRVEAQRRAPAPPPAGRRDADVPAEFEADTARLVGKPTVRQRWDVLVAEAKGVNLQQIPVIDAETPDEWIKAEAVKLRARIEKERAAIATEGPR